MSLSGVVSCGQNFAIAHGDWVCGDLFARPNSLPPPARAGWMNNSISGWARSRQPRFVSDEFRGRLVDHKVKRANPLLSFPPVKSRPHALRRCNCACTGAPLTSTGLGRRSNLRNPGIFLSSLCPYTSTALQFLLHLQPQASLWPWVIDGAVTQ